MENETFGTLYIIENVLNVLEKNVYSVLLGSMLSLQMSFNLIKIRSFTFLGDFQFSYPQEFLSSRNGGMEALNYYY